MQGTRNATDSVVAQHDPQQNHNQNQNQKASAAPAADISAAALAESLRPVMRDGRLTGAAKLLYWWLWLTLCGRPGYLAVTGHSLVAFFNDPVKPTSDSTGWKWVEKLKTVGLVDVVDRDRRSGVGKLYVYHPRPEFRTLRPKSDDRQMELPFTQPEDGEAAYRQAAEADSVGPPSGGQPAAGPAQRRGPSLTTGERQAESAEMAGGGAAAGRAQRRALHCTNEKETSKLPMSQRKLSNEFNEREPGEPVAIGSFLGDVIEDSLAKSFAAMADPKRQKAMLTERVLMTVRDKSMGHHLARKAAELVVYQNVPIDQFDTMLVHVEAMRAAGSLRSPGAFFNTLVTDLALRHGIDWQTMGTKAEITQREAKSPAKDGSDVD